MSRGTLWAGLVAVAGCVGVTVWMLRGAETTTQPATPASAGSLDAPSAPAPALQSTPTTRDSELPPAAAGPSESAADEQASPANRATTDPDAETSKSTAVASAQVAGVARDELGFVLADHVVEVSPATTGPGAVRVLEGSGVTDADGRFRIESLTPGLKDLQLLGPGGGDIWGWVSNSGAPVDKRIDLAREERRLTLAVPEAGSDDIVLRSKGHCDILVTARLVDDLSQPMGSYNFQFGREPERTSHAHSGADGALTGLVTVREDSTVELSVDDYSMELMRDAIARHEAREPEPPRRYLPIEVHLRTAPMRQDLGTLVMPRMAGLALTLVDSTNGEGIEAASVRLQCTGGGVSPSEESVAIDAQGIFLWSDRSTGVYELDVSAPGYQPVHQVGELAAGDGPQPLELILERAR